MPRMGLTNFGFSKEKPKRTPEPNRKRSYNPYAMSGSAAEYPGTNQNGSVAQAVIESRVDDYLKPINIQEEHNYEDLGQYSPQQEAVIENGQCVPSRGSTSPSSIGTPSHRRKANLIYESTMPLRQISQTSSGLSFKGKSKGYSTLFCLKLSIMLIGVIAVLSLMVVCLLLAGAIKGQRCNCEGQARALSSGYKGDNEDLLKKVKDLEANISAVSSKLGIKGKDVVQLQNSSIYQQAKIRDLQDRIKQIEAANIKLDKSVVDLKMLHSYLNRTLSQVDVHFSNEIKNLKMRIDEQNSSISANNIFNTMDTLKEKINNESIVRRKNDEAFRLKIANLSRNVDRQLNNLTDQIHKMSYQSRLDINTVENKLNETIFKKFAELMRADDKLKQDLLFLNSTLLNKFQNISLLQGPQGPRGAPGAGNLSQCAVAYEETSATIDAIKYATQEVSIILQVSQAEVVLGATCSSKNAYYRTLTMAGSTYYCKCKGTSERTGNLFCGIYLWKCPKIS